MKYSTVWAALAGYAIAAASRFKTPDLHNYTSERGYEQIPHKHRKNRRGRPK